LDGNGKIHDKQKKKEERQKAEKEMTPPQIDTFYYLTSWKFVFFYGLKHSNMLLKFYIWKTRFNPISLAIFEVIV